MVMKYGVMLVMLIEIFTLDKWLLMSEYGHWGEVPGNEAYLDIQRDKLDMYL